MEAMAAARVAAHLGRCAHCQGVRDRLQALRQDVQAGAGALDDVRRARVLSRLAAALDDQAATPRARRFPGAARAGALAIAGAAAAVALWLWGRTAPVVAPPIRPVVVQAPPVGPRPQLAVIRPELVDPAVDRLVQIRAAPGRALRPAPAVDRLEVPAGTRVRAQLGSRSRATLIGPARLQVLASDDRTLEVELRGGTLVADYDHRAGGQLRIHSPGAVTEVIGTLFSVTAGAGHSRIVVARGRVSVEEATGPARTLTAGEALTTGTPDVQRWTAADRRPLQEHDRAAPAPGAQEATEATGAPDARVPPARPSERLAGARINARRASGPRLARASAPGASDPPVAGARLDLPVPPAAATASPPADAGPAPAAPTPPAAPVSPPAPVPPALAPVPPPPAVVPPPPRVLPAQLYQQAEEAMRRRDWVTAQRRLEQLAAGGTGHPLEDVARFELAQAALRAGDRAQALHLVDDLLRSDREPALRQPARLLRCELALEGGQIPQARRCLADFRGDFPGSAHDEAALGLLIGTLDGPGACASLAPLADEYLRLHPGGPRAGQIQQRRRQCPP
jgi:hypothetical protein